MVHKEPFALLGVLLKIALLILLFRVALHAGKAVGDGTITEAAYVRQNCLGKIEVILPDKSRVDCLTLSHAIEYDFGKKWAEAVGQSLWYAANTGRRAGIVLIKPSSAQEDRLMNTIEHYGLPIDVWIIR